VRVWCKHDLIVLVAVVAQCYLLVLTTPQFLVIQTRILLFMHARGQQSRKIFKYFVVLVSEIVILYS